ncbi:MAG: hypothetical protein J6C37_07555 [Roseburia sp.]|nr:hypothetical protein [Roseburia sp.]
MDFVLDLFIALCGAYLIYAAVNMKRTGEIPAGVMIRKGVDLSGAKDIPGFISYMYGKTVVVGICTIVCGVVGLVNDTYGGLGMVQLVMTFLFFAAVVIFGIVATRAQKKYLGI